MRIRDLSQRTTLAVATLSIGVLVTIATAAAQSPSGIKPENVTHFEVPAKPADRGAYGKFDKVGDQRWTWKTRDGSNVDFVEDRQTDAVLLLKSAAFDYVVGIDFPALTSYLLNAAGTPIETSPVPITNVTFDGCDFNALRPLQGVAGLGEVAKKTKDIADEFDKELAALKKDPIKIVRGLGGNSFVLDHHHGALAWINYGRPVGTCQLLNPDPPLPAAEPAFWQELKNHKWVRLADKEGNLIGPEALPSSLTALPDDPYRTLAWMLRAQHRDGFCRALMKPQPPPFAEFLWADWLRKRPDLPAAIVGPATARQLWQPPTKKPQREAAQAEVLRIALAAAKTQAPADLPGVRSDKPANFECPVDPHGDE